MESTPHTHGQEHTQERTPEPESAPRFQFEHFADAVSAQAAFTAAFPLGSSLQPVLQALADMGARCRAVSQTEIACCYVEHQSVLTNHSWYIAVQCSSDKTIQEVRIDWATTGT